MVKIMCNHYNIIFILNFSGWSMTFRKTPQRMAILEYLSENRDHPSAEDIFREVRQNFPTMSLATVYNTLELLRERGDVLELTFDPSRKRYDPRTVEHHHLICRSCGRVADIDRNLNISLTEEERQGFVVEGNHIEFFGTCFHCLGKEV